MGEGGRPPIQMPSVDEFATAMREANGNKTVAAAKLQVSRNTLQKWIAANPEFKDIETEERKRKLDKLEDTAMIKAMGIPKLDKEGKLIGWEVPPDGPTLTKLLAIYGKDEGFNPSIDITSGGDPLPRVIRLVEDTKAVGDRAPENSAIQRTDEDG